MRTSPVAPSLVQSPARRAAERAESKLATSSNLAQLPLLPALFILDSSSTYAHTAPDGTSAALSECHRGLLLFTLPLNILLPHVLQLLPDT